MRFHSVLWVSQIFLSYFDSKIDIVDIPPKIKEMPIINSTTATIYSLKINRTPKENERRTYVEIANQRFQNG